LSGSTAWCNSVRSRRYLQAAKEDLHLRALKVMKANYGRTGEEISLRWNDGVYVVDMALIPPFVNLSNRAADDAFLAHFLKFDPTTASPTKALRNLRAEACSRTCERLHKTKNGRGNAGYSIQEYCGLRSKDAFTLLCRAGSKLQLSNQRFADSFEA
jgi:hypothetical protein